MNGEDIKTLFAVFGGILIIISLESMFASTWRRRIGYILALNLPIWFIAGSVIGLLPFITSLEDWQKALFVIFILLPLMLFVCMLGASIGILIGGLNTNKNHPKIT